MDRKQKQQRGDEFLRIAMTSPAIWLRDPDVVEAIKTTWTGVRNNEH